MTIDDCQSDDSCVNFTADIWTIRWQAVEPSFAKYDRLFCMLMGLCCLVLFSGLGTIANVLCWLFFSTKNNGFFICFRIVSSCDIIICFLSTFYGLSYVFHRQPLMFQNHPFCVSWCVIWQIFMKYSLHLVAIQSVLRTGNILKNFRVSIRILTLILVIDALMMIAPFLSARLLSAFITDGSISEVSPGIGYVKSLSSCSKMYLQPTVDTLVIQSVLLLLPMPVIIVCCALCFWELIRQNRAATMSMHGLPRINVKRRWSINSILVFSLTGLLLNFPYYCLLARRVVISATSIIVDEQVELSNIDVIMTMFGHAFITRVNVSINSFINPLIFCWRIKKCRTYVRGKWSLFRSSKLIMCAEETAYIASQSLLNPLREVLRTRFRCSSHLTRASQPALELELDDEEDTCVRSSVSTQ